MLLENVAEAIAKVKCNRNLAVAYWIKGNLLKIFFRNCSYSCKNCACWEFFSNRTNLHSQISVWIFYSIECDWGDSRCLILEFRFKNNQIKLRVFSIWFRYFGYNRRACEWAKVGRVILTLLWNLVQIPASDKKNKERKYTRLIGTNRTTKNRQ